MTKKYKVGWFSPDAERVGEHGWKGTCPKCETLVELPTVLDIQTCSCGLTWCLVTRMEGQRWVHRDDG